MLFHPTPLMLAASFVVASISAYLAHKMGRNPYLWFGIGFFFGLFGAFAIFAIPKKAPAKPKMPIFTIDGPADKFWYYLDGQNTQKGPMSRDAIALAWKEGKIGPSTYVWHEELSEWKFFKETLKQEEAPGT
jgi:hypothetical protein